MSNASMASRPGVSNRDSMAYQNIPSEQYWSEPSRFSTGPLAPTSDEYDGGAAAPAKSNKRKWIIGGSILAILAIIGIVVGVVVSQVRGNGSSSNSGSGSGSGSEQSGGDGTVNQTDPNDPSTFEKNPALHQSFWAMAYTPQVCRSPLGVVSG